jgi:hypothetical protein
MTSKNFAVFSGVVSLMILHYLQFFNKYFACVLRYEEALNKLAIFPRRSMSLCSRHDVDTILTIHVYLKETYYDNDIYICLFTVLRPSQEYFTYMETSPLPVKGCKI